ncbi:hypothetical protein [Streptomyces cyaneus]|uniref:hypothetical protein n=1 Tax=Streptomyces cyaneus TaxID=1904 RepID=UPI000FF881DE|nr:hypothetical protein [Streptomyces cyaneus]
MADLLEGFLEPAHMARFHSRGSPGFLFAAAFGFTGEPELREAVPATVSAERCGRRTPTGCRGTPPWDGTGRDELRAAALKLLTGLSPATSGRG